MLNVSNLSSNYGNIQAVRHVDLTVGDGSMVALIGANGSGKSTTLKTIAGMHPPSSGSVTFKGIDVTGWPLHKLVRHGLSFLMERPTSVVAPLTVEENLRLAAAARRTDVGAELDRMFELFPRLRERRRQHAGTLSGGEQQMVAIGRVLMTGPDLLLIDSPAIGLAPAIVDEVYATITTSTVMGCRSSSSSRTPKWRSSCRTTHTCCTGEKSQSKDPHPNCGVRRTSSMPIWHRR